MPIWFQLALVLNVVCWAFFFYLLAQRRWNWAALAVSLFHMFYGGLVSVAPFRSLLDPNYASLSLGLLRFEGQAAALPAALILGWAMAAAWLAVARTRGRWMGLIAAGDSFLALSIAGSLLLSDSNSWKFQLGEHLAISGVAGLLVLLGLLTGPLVACAIWAMKQTYSAGNTPPLAPEMGDEDDALQKVNQKLNGFRYSQSSIALSISLRC
jgi:hypothetical protein